jgi:hypothetical protein
MKKPLEVYISKGFFTLVVVPAGLEPATYGLENRCSIQLSYGTILSNNILLIWSAKIKNKIIIPIIIILAF